MKPLGYIVMEACEDYEQVLALRAGVGLPAGGILGWPADMRRTPRAMFATAAQAKAAIDRTEHYRLAFGAGLPEKKSCVVVPITEAPDE